MLFKDVLEKMPRYVDVLYHTELDGIKGNGSVNELLNKSKLHNLKVVSMTPIGAYTIIICLMRTEL